MGKNLHQSFGIAPLHLPPATLPIQDPEHSAGRDLPTWIHSILGLIDSLPEPARTIATAQISTGARACEILTLQRADVLPLGHVLLRARKRGVTRVAFAPCLLPRRFAASPQNGFRLFPHYSYSKYKRELLRSAPSILGRSAHRRCISNIFRRVAAAISSSFPGDSTALAQTFLGHRSAKSTQWYLPSQKGVTRGTCR